MKACSQNYSVVIVAAMPSTVDAFLIEQIQAMQAAGYCVTVVTSADDRLGQLRERGFEWRAVAIPRSVRPVALAIALVRLFMLFRRCRPDVVHTHTPMAAFLGQIAAWLARVPARITTVHGLYFVGEHRRIARFAFRMLEITACRLARKVICVSAEDAHYLTVEQGLATSKVMVMHVGVNLAVYSPQLAGADAREAVRRELGIPAKAFVFGTVARLVREKGLYELLDAFESLTQRHQSIYLLHVGPEDPARPDAIHQADLQKRGGEFCRFAGQRYDVPRYLAAMDVFCLPTHREGYPVSVMEAAAMGLPCIVTDIRGCREAVINGKTGLIVPPRDTAALTIAMERLLESEKERKDMSVGALERARDCFSRDVVAGKTVALYWNELKAGAQSRTEIKDASRI